jgi:hypothetical protein
MKITRIGSGAACGVIMMVWLLKAATPSSVMAAAPDWIWDLNPDNGYPHFLTFSPRLMNRDNERLACLIKASEQASKYVSVWVRASRRYARRSFFTSYQGSVKVEFSEDLAEELIKNLAVVNEFRNERGTYLLVRLTTEKMHEQALDVSLLPAYDAWVEGDFKIPGYLTAVGMAKRRRFVSASMEAADRNALFELALQVSSEVDSAILDAGRKMQSNSGQETVDQELVGVYILARTKSEDKRYYYSLAVCPKGKNSPER